MKTRYRVIGIAGKKYHGKDCVATYLKQELEKTEKNKVIQMAFATKVKELVHSLLQDLGIPTDVPKHQLLPELDVSLRHLYVTLGTSWGREMIHPRLWSMVLKKQIEKHLGLLASAESWWPPVDTDFICNIVISDIRFQDEVDVVYSFGGTMLEVIRTVNGVEYNNPDDPHNPKDASEKVSSLVYTGEKFSVSNCRDLSYLEQQCTDIIQHLQKSVQTAEFTYISDTQTWVAQYGENV